MSLSARYHSIDWPWIPITGVVANRPERSISVVNNILFAVLSLHTDEYSVKCGRDCSHTSYAYSAEGVDAVHIPACVQILSYIPAYVRVHINSATHIPSWATFNWTEWIIFFSVRLGLTPWAWQDTHFPARKKLWNGQPVHAKELAGREAAHTGGRLTLPVVQLFRHSLFSSNSTTPHPLWRWRFL